MKREEKMIDNWREDGRWGELSLARMYNDIIYMLNFDVAEGGNGKI